MKATRARLTDLTVNKTIDIRALACPYTFVKSKLAVEDMEVGEVLEILLDSEEAVKSIPKSMEAHGQEILKIEKINETDWILVVRKLSE